MLTSPIFKITHSYRIVPDKSKLSDKRRFSAMFC